MKKTYIYWAVKRGNKFDVDEYSVVLAKYKNDLFCEEEEKVRVRVTVEEVKP